MPFIFLCDGQAMELDQEDIELFSNRKLYAVQSRNTVYAAYGKNGRAHRLIAGATKKEQVVDHINGNGLDNKRSNLRIVTNSANVKNRRNSRSNNGYPPGIFDYRGKYMVQITENGQKIFGGVYNDIVSATNRLNMLRIQVGRPAI